MIVMMQVAGAGFFGTNLGIMAPAMTLILHIIYGVVLSGIYGLERPEPAHEFHTGHR